MKESVYEILYHMESQRPQRRTWNGRFRKNKTVHLFFEGDLSAVCGTSSTTYRISVRMTEVSETVTCKKCIAKMSGA